MDLLFLILLIFFCQFIYLIIFIGSGWILIIFSAVVIGIVSGVLIYVIYTEINLCIEDFSKIDVHGKSVLITGCDSGFGLMLAESLVKRGIFVFACVYSLDSNGAQNLNFLSSVKVIKMDVTNDKDVQDGFSIVKQHLSKSTTELWAIVNNAGLGHCGFLEFTPINKVRQLIEVNALGVLRVCQTFSPLLRGHGRIINLTSIAGIAASPYLGAYCISKFAAEAASKVLRIEMFSLGIPVITVQPAGYRTPMVLGMVAKLYGKDETELYGENFMLKCQEVMNSWVQTSSENTKEVIGSLESAILNKKFQYTYNPNFVLRLKLLLGQFFTDKYLVTTGCRITDLWIPTKIEQNI